MLHKLLVREWYLHRHAAWPPLAIFAAFQAYFVMNVSRATVWVVFTSIYVSFLTVTPLTRDDKFRSSSWTCTLPVTRADFVRGRYAGAWIMVAAGILVAFLVALLVPGSVLPAGLILDVNALMLAAGVSTLVLLLILPFTIRFGFSGILIALVALQLVGAGLLVFSRMTGTMDNVEGGVGAIFGPIYSTVVNLHAGLPGLVFHPLTLVVLLALNWIGYRLALALFRRREF